MEDHYDSMTRDEKYLFEALKLAERALEEGEIPVGAIVVYKDKVIGDGINSTKTDNLSTGHAEIAAINAANRYLKTDKLDGCELFTTLEPCLMCTGAVMNARISRVVFGAFDSDAGAMGGKIDLTTVFFKHSAEILGGICKQQCEDLLRRFFEEKRKSVDNNKSLW